MSDRLRTFRASLVGACLALFVCSMASHSDARCMLDGDSAARDAFRTKGEEFPWYDVGKDEIRAPRDFDHEEQASSSHRNSDWEASDSERSDRSPRNRSTNFSGEGISTVIMVLFWVFVSLLFVGLILFLIWAFMRQETALETDDVEDWLQDSRTDEQRIEDLPFELQSPKSDLLAAARAARERGDHQLAMVYLFSYMLIRLDRGHLIRLAKGKTNRQYLSEIRSEHAVRPIVERSMVTFERVFFGKHDVPSSELDSCWQSVDEFHKVVET